MRIAITDEIGNIQTLDVDEDMELLNLKALIESELNIPSIQQVIILNGKSLNDNTTTIKGCGIRNDDILLVRLAAPPVVAAEGSLNEAELTRQQIINNPQLRARLTMQQPGLERTLNDSALFNQFFAQMQRMQQQSQQPADPFDIEAQRRIEEEIRNQNILQNRANALEHHPESFARVVMLYISVEVNGHPVKAFVDSGAQMTIMSPSCAEQCNAMRLLDTSFAGMAVGVGTAKILGRIHSSMIKVGKQFLPVSLTVMEGKDVDLLFGLDMLKAHQACIDLKRNVLRINDEDISFLSEHELPKKAKEIGNDREQENPIINPKEAQHKESDSIQASTSIKQKIPESSIKTLADMGVDRNEAIHALEMTDGDIELALGIIYS